MNVATVANKNAASAINDISVWKSLNIVVIDDSTTSRHIIRDMLQKMGVTQIVEIDNGQAALRIRDSSADLLICDWNMPGMSGLDLLKQIRGASLEQAFLMVTARRDAESVIEAKAAGVTGYIVKPFTLPELKSKIRTVLAHKFSGTP